MELMYEKFIARQPFYDEKLKVFAYELLFRSGPENFFKPQKEASSSVIVDSTMLFDLQALTGNAKAFINLDLASPQRGAARLLPPSRVVIEILESIVPTPEVVQLCKDVCVSGYELALDDYVSHAKWEPLLPLVKFLKVDFHSADGDALAALARLHKSKGLQLLAEKVETQADLNQPPGA
jgi:c-di-GMP-related signal transduction protein